MEASMPSTSTELEGSHTRSPFTKSSIADENEAEAGFGTFRALKYWDVHASQIGERDAWGSKFSMACCSCCEGSKSIKARSVQSWVTFGNKGSAANWSHGPTSPLLTDVAASVRRAGNNADDVLLLLRARLKVGC